MNILDLPPNITTLIFSFLDQRDIVSAIRKTCSSWYQLSYERILWKTIDKFPDTVFTSKSFIQLVSRVSQSVECLQLDLQHLNLAEILNADVICPNLKELHVICPSSHRLIHNFDDENADYGEVDEETATFTDKICKNGGCLNECLPKLSTRYSNLRKLHICGGGGLTLIELLTDKFTNLEQIKFVKAKVEKAFDIFLENHNAISHITFKSCIISKETLSIILSKLPCIEALDLSNSKSSQLDCWDHEGAIDMIDEDKKEKFEKLKTLNLSFTTCTDSVLGKIVKYSWNLKFISIIGCRKITNIGLDEIAKHCPNLETLCVNESQYSECNITNAGLQRISEHCKNLRVLQANYCSEVSDVSVQAIAESCKQLRELRTAGCTALTDNAVLSLVENCHMIAKLNLGSCVQLTSRCVDSIFTECKNLVYLNLETCHRLTDINLQRRHENKGLNSEMQHKNTDLNLETCQMITDSAENENEKTILGQSPTNGNDQKGKISHLHIENRTEEELETKIQNALKALENHSHLRTLNLRFCSRLTNNCIREISRFCPDMRELDIGGCSMVTNSGVRYVTQGCVFLETLDISGGSVSQTSRLTDDCLHNIADNCENLKALIIVKNYNITSECVFEVIQKCPNISLLRVSQHYKRANINPQHLKLLATEVVGKTIRLNLHGEVDIHVYRDPERKIGLYSK